MLLCGFTEVIHLYCYVVLSKLYICVAMWFYRGYTFVLLCGFIEVIHLCCYVVLPRIYICVVMWFYRGYTFVLLCGFSEMLVSWLSCGFTEI